MIKKKKKEAQEQKMTKVFLAVKWYLEFSPFPGKEEIRREKTISLWHMSIREDMLINVH